MADQKFKSARDIAAEVLNRCDPKRNYAGAILDSLRHETDQSQRATDLVFGTLRNRMAIDTVIATFSGRPVKSTARRPLREIQGRLLNIIRVGTYELIYCPSTEQYAIVNEAVANAKASGSDKQAGFVNAVLRQITRHISNRSLNLKLKTKNSKFYNTNCTLPQTPVTGCQFDADFLPDSKKSPSDYLSTVFSLPRWLVVDWITEFGEESTRRICLASNRRPSVYIRPNRLRTTIEALTEKLDAAEVGFDIIPDVDMIRIKGPQDVTQLPGFAEGQFTIQDITTSMPVRMLNPQPGWVILDLCAAPGTKTTQLAEATGDSAKIMATDIDSRRLEKVRENTTRLGMESINIAPYKELLNSQFSIQNSKFDCVLLDVPCSNTGVLARRVEARYRIGPEAVKELTRIQGRLLKAAAEMLKPGGKICYSTCSIQKTENGGQIMDFLKQNQNFSLESEQLTLPSAEGFDHDGGYVAILTKRETKD
jgi:16S rRNA (cytosine967-C5)-methyltransferase